MNNEFEPSDEYWDNLYEEKKDQIDWINYWSSDLTDSGLEDSNV